MKKAVQEVEILAPAGSYESFLAAVHAGSNAVYLGGNLFSARAFAENFSKEQLLNAIDYAHLHGRKIYMTVNTLLKEEELKQIPEYLLPYYKQGLDAVIVQDLGVLEMVANVFPDMAIHLSTQMTLTGSMGARLFEKTLSSFHYPITRIVPARELSLEEIKKLRKETNLELEVFVHGALCVSYSGQCFLSSMIGGRSGNRGRCAQPCRKLYTSKTKTSYILSPKDLCTLEMIPDLIEAGIDSFKIEGRMKKPAYTAYISWLYKKYVNRFLKYGRKEYEAYFKKYPQELEDDLRNMKDLYNRGGFSKGYFFNHNGKDMISMERSNHTGVFVGKVKTIKKNEMEILWEQEIYPQDILEVRSYGKQIYEYTSGQKKEQKEKSAVKFCKNAGVKPEMEVFRTRNNQLLLWIEENIIKTSLKKKLCGKFYASIGKEISLTIWEKTGKEKNIALEQKNCITVKGTICQMAQNQPLSEEMIRRQLSKLGDTEFIWETLDIEIEGDIFLPIKSLNELRRQAFEKFQKEYKKQFFRETENNRIISKDKYKQEQRQERNRIDSKKKPRIAAQVLTREQWQAALSSNCVSIIYAGIELLEQKELLSLAEETRKRKKQCFLSLPMILREPDRQMVRNIIEVFTREKQKQLCNGFLLHNIEELGFIIEILGKDTILEKKEWDLIADFSMYSTNSMAMNFWHMCGCKRVTASIEQNLEELRSLFSEDNQVIKNGLETEFLLYGRIPLMVSAQCIASYGENKNCKKQQELKLRHTILLDEKGESMYAVNFCRFCYNILYSGKKLDLLRQKDKLLQVPFQVLRCSFTDETKQETKDILEKVEMIGEKSVRSEQGKEWIGHFHKGMI